MTTYLAVMYLISLALAYVITFTSTTLAMGRALSETRSGTGYQDAITPPRFATIALLVHGSWVAGVAYGIWAFGWLVGIGSGLGLLIAASLNKALLLPKSNSEHFRKIIVHSMAKRYSAYVKSGNTLRASLMGELLGKVGVSVEELTA